MSDATPKGIDQATFNAGKEIYSSYCFTCHGANGEGMAGVNPPLAGSEWVIADDPSTIIRMQLRGIMGPIEVKGEVYQSAMPPSAHYTDEQLSGVFTYIRNAWGNSASAVTPAQVKAVRDEGGTGMLMASDLERPKPPAEKALSSSDAAGSASAATATTSTATPAKSYEPIEFETSGTMTWPLIAGFIVLLISLLGVFLGKRK